MKHTANMPLKILFSGGGTLGSVMPLIAVADEFKRHYGEHVHCMWIGTFGGLERAVVRAHHIEFHPIMSVKWRRYISFENVIDILCIPLVLLHAWYLLFLEKPDVVVSAGGFVSVPIHIVAWCMHIPSVIHHQDIETGLANKIMRIFAKRVSATFQHTLKELHEAKSRLTGNPIRSALIGGDRDRAYARYHLDPSLPTTLIFGGGTGALSLNSMIAEILLELLHSTQIIHITGQGKHIVVPHVRGEEHAQYMKRYITFEFLLDEEMADAYAIADVVVCRAGLSTLSELASLHKAAVLVPIPDSHQEHNAEFFEHQQAVRVMHMNTGSSSLSREVLLLLNDNALRLSLQKNIGALNNPQAHKELVKVILEAQQSTK